MLCVISSWLVLAPIRRRSHAPPPVFPRVREALVSDGFDTSDDGEDEDSDCADDLGVDYSSAWAGAAYGVPVAEAKRTMEEHGGRAAGGLRPCGRCMAGGGHVAADDG